MANQILKFDPTPFSEMESTPVNETLEFASIETPVNYEADDEMMDALERRHDFDAWTASFGREL